MLIRGYERAKFEEDVHHRQKDLRKYEKLFEQYAYPINATYFERDDKSNVIDYVNEEATTDMTVGKM